MKKSQIAAIGAVSALSLALFGWGAVAGAGGADSEVMGIMAGAGDAAIVAENQPEAKGSVVISKVVAPADSFVVIHQSDGGMPGKRVGYVSVPAGTSRDVRVKLDPKVALTPELLAAVHADRGKSGELEFDMENMERSPDRPYFVGGAEVAVGFIGAEFGVPAGMDDAMIEAGDQPLGKVVKIAKAVAPTDAFVVVHKATADGMPGARVGYAPIKAGENSNVEVTLDKKLTGTVKLLAAIHADRGVAGTLEFDMDDPIESPDQPFFAEGMEVATAFTVGPFGVKTDNASIEATDQVGAEKTITVSRVDAPADAWIVVHKEVNGGPGERVGVARVTKGVSENVEVELDTDMLSEKLLIALHADRGTSEKFDFDMTDILGSADQPYFVDGAEVATAIKVRTFGYPTEMGTASIKVADQEVMNGFLRVTEATAPENSWVVVHQDAGGMPGARVGLVHIPSGTSRGVVVQLDASKDLTDKLFIAVHADRGEAGMFEFNMMDGVNSADQPFFVGDMEVATAASIR